MPVPAAEPISRVPTRETVAETLRAWIVDGTLAPEEVLRDADLAQTFGISRTPVREALLQLEHEGLVESHPGRWTRVTPLDPAMLVHFYPVWVELEALAARMAATATGSPADEAVRDAAQAFEAAVDAARAEPSSVHLRAIDTAAARFYDLLLARAGNPLLSSTLAPLRLKIRRYVSTCPEPLAPSDTTVADHQRLLAAILAGDPDIAASATRATLDHTYQRLCSGWGIRHTE